MRSGMSPLEAAHRTMDEVGGALISIALTLCAVFVPAVFLSGISGLFFRQFAVTIAASTVISCFVSLTLSPALCAVLFKAHPRAGSGLPHQYHSAAARCDVGPDREGLPSRHRYHPGDERR
jgi:multidrug efflux pump subunit AcrB